MGYDKEMGGFDDKSVEENDIYFLFIRPVNEVLDEERIEPVEEAVVNMCKSVDVHYTYTANGGKHNGTDGNSEPGDSDAVDGDFDLQDVMDC